MNDQIAYCSGPMFSTGDKWEQANIAALLEAGGFTTYLPQRDGLEVGQLMGLLLNPLISSQVGVMAMAIVRKVVYSLDIYQLLGRCTCVVFNLDGRVPDEGSVVETSIAYASGKPLVIYKSTPITMLAGTDNPMVEGLSSTWVNVSTTTEIVPALVARIAAQADSGYVYTPPPNVALIIELGSQLSDPNADLRVILGRISAAPSGEDALKEAQALLTWAQTSRAYRAAFGTDVSFRNADGKHRTLALG